jgi:hypothetical protein
MEAELIEPELFLPLVPGATQRYAECLTACLARLGPVNTSARPGRPRAKDN